VGASGGHREQREFAVSVFGEAVCEVRMHG
jgi:hypothetical protein